jgi:hypothetical protein
MVLVQQEATTILSAVSKYLCSSLLSHCEPGQKLNFVNAAVQLFSLS